tara:strand:- start:6225 stop:7283 length:1059 start_codon:yes stop_codon:yes gene_type:complete
MFGVGAFEFVLVLLIAMIVLGPDRIPVAMRTLGRWVRQLRKVAADFRQEFDEEISILRGEVQALREEAELTRAELQEIQDDIAQTVGEAQGDLEEAADDISGQIRSTGQAVSGTQEITPRPHAHKNMDTGPVTEIESSSTFRHDLDPADSMFDVLSTTSNADTNYSNIEPPFSPIETLGWDSIRQLSPSGQNFGAMLRLVVNDETSVLDARNLLAQQAEIDAKQLAGFMNKGPLAAAICWAAQKQFWMNAGDIDIDQPEDSTVRIRLYKDPYGLDARTDGPAAILSQTYDLTLLEKLGVEGEFTELLSHGSSYTELILRNASTQKDDSEPNASDADLLSPEGTVPTKEPKPR